MKYLIIYNSIESLILSEFTEGTAVATPYSFLVTSDLVAAKTGLEALGINCLLIENEINNPSIIQL